VTREGGRGDSLSRFGYWMDGVRWGVTGEEGTPSLSVQARRRGVLMKGSCR
jgi:hypothetical protein